MELFKPEEGQNIFVTYPELKEYPQLEKLKPKEIGFVWNYCNLKREQPELKPNERAYNAYIAVYGETKDSIQSEYVNGNFKFHIREAIRVMEKFSLPHRIRAKAMAEKMFKKLEQSIESDEIDPVKYKQCSDTIPLLLKQIEQGFGVKDTESKDDGKKKPTLMDNLLNEINN